MIFVNFVLRICSNRNSDHITKQKAQQQNNDELDAHTHKTSAKRRNLFFVLKTVLLLLMRLSSHAFPLALYFCYIAFATQHNLYSYFAQFFFPFFTKYIYIAMTIFNLNDYQMNEWKERERKKKRQQMKKNLLQKQGIELC